MRFIASLLEPAALIGWLLLACAVLAWRARAGTPAAGALRWSLLASLLVFGLLATPLGANALLRPLEAQAERLADACPTPADSPVAPRLAVVLAGGVNAAARNADDYAWLDQPSLRRTLMAAQWQRAQPGRRLLVSGGSGAVPEAVLMAQLLAALGLPREAVQIEAQSRTTTDSAAAVRALLPAAADASVVLITSASHMGRAHRSFAAQGLRVCALPVDAEYVAPLWPDHLVPQLSALGKSTRALHEYLGLLWRPA
jgi:uncharacterized SAM-binding protein YcdF (DUF218 family)